MSTYLVCSLAVYWARGHMVATVNTKGCVYLCVCALDSVIIFQSMNSPYQKLTSFLAKNMTHAAATEVHEATLQRADKNKMKVWRGLF